MRRHSPNPPAETAVLVADECRDFLVVIIENVAGNAFEVAENEGFHSASLRVFTKKTENPGLQLCIRHLFSPHQLPSKRPLHIVLSAVPTLFVGTKSKDQTVKQILQFLLRLHLARSDSSFSENEPAMLHRGSILRPQLLRVHRGSTPE